MKAKVYSVSEINALIAGLMEERFAAVYVGGEISNVKLAPSGHIYFTLKDENAQLAAAFFRRDNINLKFQLQNGLEAICRGRIAVYEKRGIYQLYVHEVQPKGIGALQLAFEQLKKRLSEEGLFDKRFKKPIPELPRRVGVVTSLQGAAVRDILKVFRGSFVDLEVTVSPVRVQGKSAAREIARAIDELNALTPPPDILIVGRGGGSLEDLWAFNEEAVARAIFRSRVPVISAVGHEIDFTIADMVADMRASTPSAAAQSVVARKEEALTLVKGSAGRLQNAMDNILALAETRLADAAASYILKDPLNLFSPYQEKLEQAAKNITRMVSHRLDICAETFRATAGKLQALSPLNILKRGYSVSWLMPQERLLKSVAALVPGERVKTRLARGEFISRVEEVKNG